MIEDALSSSPRRRLRAIETAERTLASGYVARDLLLSDSDARVRAAAAHLIGRCRSPVLAPALREALFDDKPFVRHAATLSLARLRHVPAAGQLSRHALEDPIWWVRRAAVLAQTRLIGADAIPTFRKVLDDPFWRVRYAAVGALLSLSSDPSERDELLGRLGEPESSRAHGAVSYLRRRLGLVDAPPPAAPAVKAAELSRPADPDPAVVTARLERGDKASLAFLVECLGDSHESLRTVAAQRLRKHGDRRALTMAFLWLEEPRIPHAAETVIALLDSIDPPRADALLDHALAEGPDGATCWALSTIAERDDQDRIEHVLRLTASPFVLVRRVAIAALGQLFRHARDSDRIVSVLCGARGDPDEDVARFSADALVGTGLPTALGMLAREAPSADVLVRRIQVEAANAVGHTARLQQALVDDDPMARSVAIRALAASGELDCQALEALESDVDPWIRKAVLSAANAQRVLENDASPALRRAAFSLIKDRKRAAVAATTAADPWLRARSAALFDTQSPKDLRRLLKLTRDTSRAVRAAAWETLDRDRERDEAGLQTALNGFLANETDAELRIAAYAARAQGLGAADLEHLRLARETEPPPVRGWIQDVLSGATDVVPEVRQATLRRSEVRAPTARRQLGRTGLEISPIALSGAGDLAESDLHRAMDAGCNLFFWEPRYLSLGRFLRRASPRDSFVIAGSFHASENGILADVDRALRRLRRDTLDVFLLFWTRSPVRLDCEALATLSRLKEQGKIRAMGFSTHDRELACDAIPTHRPDVIMIRHSAAHPGAEERLFPLAREAGVGVLTFSALCYGRLLTEGITATDAYRYSLTQLGVSAVISAPRRPRELRQNLDVLKRQTLAPEDVARLRLRGQAVRNESRDFNELLRRFPLLPADAEAEWADDAEPTEPAIFPEPSGAG